jgi:hypothetical protein
MHTPIPAPRVAPMLVRIVALSLPVGVRGAVATCACSGAPADAAEVPPIVSEGRRPHALRSDGRVHDGCEVGRWLARMAHDEAASVHAFTTLADELVAHGAPRALVTRARAAARDEVRHARVARRLASRHGVRTPRARVGRAQVRPLVQVAVENAREGCVNEAFASVVALWQSRQAGDTELRDEMATIARDEVRHAELAWDVQAWADARLTGPERRDVLRARREALDALHDAAVPRGRVLVERLGLPTAEQMSLLAARMEEMFG